MASITTELVETGSKRDGRGRKITTPAEKEALVTIFKVPITLLSEQVSGLASKKWTSIRRL